MRLEHRLEVGLVGRELVDPLEVVVPADHLVRHAERADERVCRERARARGEFLVTSPNAQPALNQALRGSFDAIK